MGALSQTYVDPSIAGNSGAGTVGDPYGDIQYALDTITRDGTNGDQINVKAGTDEILAAALTTATYGTPSWQAPLLLRGYTSAADDGGIGGIDGNATYTIMAATPTAIMFKDLHLHNSGSATILTVNDWGIIDNVEFDNTSGIGLQCDVSWQVTNCHFHDIGSQGLLIRGASLARGNYFKNGTKTFTSAIDLAISSRGTVVDRNIISIDGASNGIRLFNYFTTAINNSVLSSSGTGKGIFRGNNDGYRTWNNLVEGFSGAGGVGIEDSSDHQMTGHNGAFNNATNYSFGSKTVDLGDNEALGATPFDKSGSDTFANRFIYFAPVDTGNVQGGAHPNGDNLDKGAVQHADPAGGGGSQGRRIIRIGGYRGTSNKKGIRRF